MRKVCVYIGGRANYSSIKSAMKAISDHKDLKLQVLTGASAILDRYGCVEELIKSDGFHVDQRFFSVVEGETPLAMAQTTGLGLIHAATALNNLNPDFVLVVGDRFDVLPVAIAAVYMNIPLAHTMGGEVTGTIDESIRHALSKLAHIHFVANEDAKNRVIKMGERTEAVFNTGCPRNDLVLEELNNNHSREKIADLFERYGGVGGNFSLDKPFLLVSQHPVTTEYGHNRSNMNETLEALHELSMDTILLWPNVDAGGDEISRAIRVFREKNNPSWLRVFKNLSTTDYIHLMNTTTCLIGNSSSGIREGALIGTPVVNIGTRQQRRETGQNVITVNPNRADILKAIKFQIDHGQYERDPIYGDGKAGEKIADILSKIEVNVQKVIEY